MSIINKLKGNLHNMRAFIGMLNKNEMEILSGELHSEFYWYKKYPEWYSEDKYFMSKLKQAKRLVKKRLKTGRVRPELSDLGAVIDRFYLPFGGTPLLVTVYLSSSWEMVSDTVWCNPEEHKLCTYCNGDVALYSCKEEELYNKELLRLKNT